MPYQRTLWLMKELTRLRVFIMTIIRRTITRDKLSVMESISILCFFFCDFFLFVDHSFSSPISLPPSYWYVNPDSQTLSVEVNTSNKQLSGRKWSGKFLLSCTKALLQEFSQQQRRLLLVQIAFQCWYKETTPEHISTTGTRCTNMTTVN